MRWRERLNSLWTALRGEVKSLGWVLLVAAILVTVILSLLAIAGWWLPREPY